nr:putative prefoldin subunit 2 [Quercus suber]
MHDAQPSRYCGGIDLKWILEPGNVTDGNIEVTARRWRGSSRQARDSLAIASTRFILRSVEQNRRAVRTPRANCEPDLQVQYSNYKDTLQAIASKIGDVEQEAEEHKHHRLCGVLFTHSFSRNQKVPIEARLCYRTCSLISRRDRLVLETLAPLPGSRKCFRMINGVLVERTVSDVLPALQTNADGLKQVLEDLVKQYRTKQDDMEKWKVGQAFRVTSLQRRSLTIFTEEEQRAGRTTVIACIRARVLYLRNCQSVINPLYPRWRALSLYGSGFTNAE